MREGTRILSFGGRREKKTAWDVIRASDIHAHWASVFVKKIYLANLTVCPWASPVLLGDEPVPSSAGVS